MAAKSHQNHFLNWIFRCQIAVIIYKISSLFSITISIPYHFQYKTNEALDSLFHPSSLSLEVQAAAAVRMSLDFSCFGSTMMSNLNFDFILLQFSSSRSTTKKVLAMHWEVLKKKEIGMYRIKWEVFSTFFNIDNKNHCQIRISINQIELSRLRKAIEPFLREILFHLRE